VFLLYLIVCYLRIEQHGWLSGDFAYSHIILADLVEILFSRYNHQMPFSFELKYISTMTLLLHARENQIVSYINSRNIAKSDTTINTVYEEPFLSHESSNERSPRFIAPERRYVEYELQIHCATVRLRLTFTSLSTAPYLMLSRSLREASGFQKH
jgi:hypothetical protein